MIPFLVGKAFAIGLEDAAYLREDRVFDSTQDVPSILNISATQKLKRVDRLYGWKVLCQPMGRTCGLAIGYLFKKLVNLARYEFV